MRNAGNRIAMILAVSTLAIAPAAWAEEWVSVAKSDRVEMFVSKSSLSRAGNLVKVQTKENFAAEQPSAKKGKTYLSASNDYRIDCTARRVAYSANRAYSGSDLSGEVVQKASHSDKNLEWMDAPAGTVFGELLDYACKYAAPTAAAPPK